MADLSKEEKKALIKVWQAEQNEDYILTEENAQELFEYLEEHIDNFGCDHTLRYTEQWLAEHFSAEIIENIVAEITDMGGYCDCEVLLNCYENYDIG
jgi:hypothetical protein